jgi:hypothetical protein
VIAQLEAEGAPSDDDRWWMDEHDVRDDDPEILAHKTVIQEYQAPDGTIKERKYDYKGPEDDGFDTCVDPVALYRDKLFGVVDEKDWDKSIEVCTARRE